MPIGPRATSSSGATGSSSRCVRSRTLITSIWSPAKGGRHHDLSHRVVIAIEVMPARELHDLQSPQILQVWTNAFRIIVAVNTQGGYGKARRLRTHRQSGRAVGNPVREMKLEIRALIESEQCAQHDAPPREWWQAIDGKGQHVRPLRVADEERARLFPVKRVVAQDAIEIDRQLLRRARRPEIAQR